MKTKNILKITALFLCIVMILPMLFACGEKSDDAGSKKDDGGTAAANNNEAATPEPTDPPTEPEPTEPPTEKETEPPFVLEPIDPNLPYWEQILNEMGQYGLTDGVKILPGEDEAALMKGFSTGNTKKEELDVSGDNVPFTAAYRVVTAKDSEQFWSCSYNRSFEKDIETEEEDLVVGVIWVRGERLSETDDFDMDDEPAYYLAIKTSTDNWGTEGNVDPHGEQWATPEWRKIFFCGYVLNEESKSQNMQMQIFLGYGNQYIDFGGIIAYVYPGTLENELAAMKLVDSNYTR